MNTDMGHFNWCLHILRSLTWGMWLLGKCLSSEYEVGGPEFESPHKNWAWWHMSAISVLEMPKQEDL